MPFMSVLLLISFHPQGVMTTVHHSLTLLIKRTQGLLELKAALIAWMWTNLRLSVCIVVAPGAFS